jgi:hypothetical protein
MGNDVPSAVEDKKQSMPFRFGLFQNYPNPFNPSTTIEFMLPISEKVKLDIFNITGQKVETLVDQRMKAGEHSIEFDAKNLASGVYFYQIQAGLFRDVKKMIVIK